MDAVKEQPWGFFQPLELEYMDGHLWRLTACFDYHLKHDNGREVVPVPIGFVTDFASIPRVLWNILPPTGGYGKAAVIHDALYQKRIVTNVAGISRFVDRGEADAILKEAMEVLGVGWFTRWTIYSGVRTGGWLAWGRYREAESKGAPTSGAAAHPQS